MARGSLVLEGSMDQYTDLPDELIRELSPTQQKAIQLARAKKGYFTMYVHSRNHLKAVIDALQHAYDHWPAWATGADITKYHDADFSFKFEGRISDPNAKPKTPPPTPESKGKS